MTNTESKSPEGNKPTRSAPPRLKALYDSEIKAKLKSQFGYSNVMEVPRLIKVTVNMGLGEAVQNPKMMESAVNELRAICGQSPVVTKAKKDIATFKLRKGHKIGAAVTLRRERMWEFVDRLVTVALPRTRDFRGISHKAFDGRGNYNLGLKEQIIFPEVDYDSVDSVKGMNISFVTTASNNEEGRALLKELGFPFRIPSTSPQGAQA